MNVTHNAVCANCGKHFEWHNFSEVWQAVTNGKQVLCCSMACSIATIRAEIERLKSLSAYQQRVAQNGQGCAVDLPSACPACGTLVEESEHDPTCPLFT